MGPKQVQQDLSPVMQDRRTKTIQPRAHPCEHFWTQFTETDASISQVPAWNFEALPATLRLVIYTTKRNGRREHHPGPCISILLCHYQSIYRFASLRLQAAYMVVRVAGRDTLRTRRPGGDLFYALLVPAWLWDSGNVITYSLLYRRFPLSVSRQYWCGHYTVSMYIYHICVRLSSK